MITRHRFWTACLLGSLLACGDAEVREHAPEDGDEPTAQATDGSGTKAPTKPGDDAGCTLPEPSLAGPALTPFESDGELDAYLTAVTTACGGSVRGGADAGALSGATAGSSPVADSEASNEDITNTQESGVDEGGIVKNIGDALVVLRQGRLYAVDVATPGAPRQTDSLRVAATEGLNGGVWYDEMLVRGELIYVVGYRYSVPLQTDQAEVSFGGRAGATEIDVFRLQGGKLARVGQTFIESWDYYSGSNYASRMVDGRLLFYMPVAATRGQVIDGDGKRRHGVPAIPRVLRHDAATGRFHVVGPLFTPSDVQRPLTRVRSPVFHTVVRCDLADSGALACSSKAVLGDYGRQFYVSPTRIYLWSQEHVFAMGLREHGVSVHRVEGYPRSQFAFKELDETLHVATSQQDALSMWSLPLAAFDREGKQDIGARRTTLASLGRAYLAAERFVGSTYVAAASSWSGGQEPHLRITYDVRGGLPPRVEPSHVSYQRIEPLGTNRALLVGQQQSALSLEVWTLSGSPRRTSALALPSAAEGESRSHGFFYKSLEGDHGLFGLPVLSENAPGQPRWFGRGAANIAFFDVSAQHQLSSLGAVSSTGARDVCETSCVDWYGNTRPIFLRDRAFALMGSELVEVQPAPATRQVGDRLVLSVPPRERQ